MCVCVWGGGGGVGREAGRSDRQHNWILIL